MHRTAIVLAAIAMALTAPAAVTQTRRTGSDDMKTVAFLVGTWSCSHTVGDFSGTYPTTYALTVGDRWLKQTYDFPAAGEDAAVHAEYFLGYDVRVDRWVRFGAHSNAQYYGMVGKRADNVWSWSYVLPGPSGSAVWTKQSDVEYTIDGPSYPKNGTLVTEHHRCRKG